MLYLVHQNLLVLIDLITSSSIIQIDNLKLWFSSLQRTIRLKKVKNEKENLFFELKKNNEFIDYQLRECLDLIHQSNFKARGKQGKEFPLSTIYLVIKNCLRKKNSFSIEQAKQFILNAVFLTIYKKMQQKESVLKNIYQQFDDNIDYRSVLQ